MRWRIGLRPTASLLQANYALTRALEDRGAVVIEGGERWTDDGGQVVRMLVGLPRRPTHELLIVRRRADPDDAASDPARLALVLYGFGEEVAEADSFFALPAPFTVAVVPGTKSSQRVLRHAREREREVVLHLPLEPLNYPHTQDMTVMTAVYRELKRRHVTFLHVAPAAGAVCKSLAADMGVRYAQMDAVLDGEARQADARALDRRWNALLKEAHERGRMVVMLRATPTSRRWLPRALALKRLDGVSLVPLASLLEQPEGP
jgi:polysaccharide deacetylase 2 family uncharacterized protein YibQ